MKLSDYNRSKFNKYLKPLYTKDYCEECGSKDTKLELHHTVQFIELLRYIVEDKLYLKFVDDKKVYTDEQIELIQYMMLGIQTKIKYKILCDKCHSKIKNTKIFNRKPKDIEKAYKFNLYKYIESLIGKKLYKDDRNDLANKLHIVDSKNRQVNSYRVLNEFLNRNYKINIIKSVDYSKYDENKNINKYRGLIYWILEKNK